jgi:hypothetical protein
VFVPYVALYLTGPMGASTTVTGIALAAVACFSALPGRGIDVRPVVEAV